MVEHHNGIVGVRGSNPLGSTSLKDGATVPLSAGVRPEEISRLTWGRIDLGEKPSYSHFHWHF